MGFGNSFKSIFFGSEIIPDEDNDEIIEKDVENNYEEEEYEKTLEQDQDLFQQTLQYPSDSVSDRPVFPGGHPFDLYRQGYLHRSFR